jgi:hypothetical protein
VIQAAARAGAGKSNVMSVDRHVNDVSGPTVAVEATLQSTDLLMRMLGRCDMRKGSRYAKPLNPNLNLGKISSSRPDLSPVPAQNWDFRLSNTISMSHS